MYEKLSNHFWTRKGKWVIKMKISTLFRFNCLLTACSKYISLSEKAPHYTDLDSQSEQSFTHIWMHRGYLEITCNAWLLKITQPQYTQSGLYSRYWSFIWACCCWKSPKLAVLTIAIWPNSYFLPVLLTIPDLFFFLTVLSLVVSSSACHTLSAYAFFPPGCKTDTPWGSMPSHQLKTACSLTKF